MGLSTVEMQDQPDDRLRKSFFGRRSVFKSRSTSLTICRGDISVRNSFSFQRPIPQLFYYFVEEKQPELPFCVLSLPFLFVKPHQVRLTPFPNPLPPTPLPLQPKSRSGPSTPSTRRKLA